MNAILNSYRRIFDFNGKSSITEFWNVYFFTFFLYLFLNIVGKRYDVEWLKYAFLAIQFLPILSLGFRRLNDAGINKWYFLIPGANIYLASMPSSQEAKAAR